MVASVENAITTGSGTGADQVIEKQFPAGNYMVRLTATNSRNASQSAEKEIFVNRMPISVKILSPAPGEKILIKDNPIKLVAEAFDPEDGPLTGSALKWSSRSIAKLFTSVDIDQQQLAYFNTPVV